VTAFRARVSDSLFRGFTSASFFFAVVTASRAAVTRALAVVSAVVAVVTRF
jgi:hypothetical protein